MLWSMKYHRKLPVRRSQRDGSHMAKAPQQLGIGIRRRFTTAGTDPYDTVEWERRDSRIPNYKDGGDAFFQSDVEFPTSWSLNATNIVAQKYFRGTLGTAERETSLRQVIDRVADTVTDWGIRDGYFVDDTEARGLPRRAQVRARAPARRVQLAGVVQHRREGRAAAGERVPALRRARLDPRRSRPDRQARRRRRGRRQGVRRARHHA